MNEAHGRSLKNPRLRKHPFRRAPRTPPPSGSGIGPEPSCASTKRQRDWAGASLGSDQTSPSRAARKPHPPPSFPASAGPIPRSPFEAPIPSASPGTLPPQIRCEPPGGCGVPSERTGCVPHQHRAFPRSPHKYAQRSGTGPERALEANTKAPRAQRESPILPRASSASAGSIPRSPPCTQPQSSSGSLPTALLRLQFNRVSIRTSTCIVRSVSPL